jgi:hypothetical protein
MDMPLIISYGDKPIEKNRFIDGLLLLNSVEFKAQKTEKAYFHVTERVV